MQCKRAELTSGLWLAGLGLALLGCSDAPAPSPGDDGDPGALPALVWQDGGVREVEVDLGRTATITIDVPAGQRFVAIRVRPVFEGFAPAETTVCYQIDALTTATGARWIDNSRRHRDWGPACKRCVQRTMSLPALGTFAFPNDGQPLGDPGELRFRVVLRDCATGVAADSALNPDIAPRVRIQWASEPENDKAAAVLHVALVGKIAADAEVVAAIALKRLSDKGFVTRVRKVAGVDDLSPREVPVRWLKCAEIAALRPEKSGPGDLLGFVPRIPGGLTDPAVDTGAHDGVFIASDGCGDDPLTMDKRGRLLAHELGHYLGLYHSDGPWGAHRKPAGADLMATNALGLAKEPDFNDRQLRVIRSHPGVALQPTAP